MADNLPRTQSEILIYQTEDGRMRIDVRLEDETVCLSLNQMAELFQRDKSVISRHIRNVFLGRGGGLRPESTAASFATVQTEGKRQMARRADAEKPNMGLASWSGDTPRQSDAEIAKNYLRADELDILNRIVTTYLEFAELQALNRKPMYMKDWIAKLDEFLRISDREILQHAGRVSHDEALEKARLEYEKSDQKYLKFFGRYPDRD